MTTVQLFLIIGNIWIARGCPSRILASLIGLLYIILAVMLNLSGQ
jgi:hypothetical protein